MNQHLFQRRGAWTRRLCASGAVIALLAGCAETQLGAQVAKSVVRSNAGDGQKTAPEPVDVAGVPLESVASVPAMDEDITLELAELLVLSMRIADDHQAHSVCTRSREVRSEEAMRRSRLPLEGAKSKMLRCKMSMPHGRARRTSTSRRGPAGACD